MPDDPFGAPIGKMVDSSGVELKNNFTDISSQDVEDMLQSTRVQPRQVGTGVMRGTQRIVDTDGSYITMGAIPETNGEFGFAFFDADGTLISKYLATEQSFFNSAGTIISQQTAQFQAFYDDSGNLISKSTGTTDYKYDLTTGKNYYQNGKLPDNSYGAIFVKTGVNVADVFS